MSPAGVPTDQVLSMRQQNLSNNQVIQSLQRQGYTADQIFDAMNQADMKGGVEGYSSAGYDVVGEPQNQMPQAPFSPPRPQTPPSANYDYYGADRDRIEEVAEEIIEEKWNDLVKNINRVVEWKNQTEAKIAQLDQQITDLKKDFDELHKAVIGKIGEYDQNILNVGTEIKAMEKVFREVLPVFTEKVNELSRVTKVLKTGSSAK